MAVQALVPAETELSILIVDDDEAANRSLSLGLGAHGYHVATVADGASVLQRLAQEPFDLLLIDTMMPGMNGVETLRQIKRVSPRLLTPSWSAHPGWRASSPIPSGQRRRRSAPVADRRRVCALIERESRWRTASSGATESLTPAPTPRLARRDGAQVLPAAEVEQDQLRGRRPCKPLTIGPAHPYPLRIQRRCASRYRERPGDVHRRRDRASDRTHHP